MISVQATVPTGVIFASPNTSSMYQLRAVAIDSPESELTNVRLALFELTPDKYTGTCFTCFEPKPANSTTNTTMDNSAATHRFASLTAWLYVPYTLATYGSTTNQLITGSPAQHSRHSTAITMSAIHSLRCTVVSTLSG